MLTKKTYKLIILSTLVISSCSRQEFNQAVDQAKSEKLTEVNQGKPTVSYYSQNNLDPIWEANANIVKIPQMELMNQKSQKIDQSLFKDKITFVTFFFSSCAGFCPVTIKNLQKVEATLKQFKNIQYVGISVDPHHDTPEKLKKYFSHMKLTPDKWNLLTGDKDLIYNLARETLKSEVFDLPKSKGQISHSERYYIIDPELRLRGVIKGTRLDSMTRALELVTALEEENKVAPVPQD